MTTSEDQAGQATLKEQPFVSHLLELRDRLLRVVIVAFVIFLVLFPFANDLYTALATPLIKHLPEGTGMIATRVIAPFLTPLKMTFVFAIFLAIPYILHQLWSFIAPGLYRHEKRLAVPLLVSSVFLFYLGMSFAYFVVFPLLFDILPSMAPEQITVSPDITDYLDFVLTLFFAFGMAFEVPIATIILVWMGITTPQSLAEKRPYIVIGAFGIGMLLTPPDVISQTLLAVPMWILFEVGLICSRAFARDRDEPPQPATPQQTDDDPLSSLGTPNAASVSAANNASADHQASTQHQGFNPLTQDELAAELDRIEEAQDSHKTDKPSTPKPHYSADMKAAEMDVDAKLRLVADYRDEADEERARALLYEVLADGDDDQIRVAKNILKQMDGDY
ncbi:twin-arginine translocase subunit TatC [Pseudomonadota bacterium]